MPEPSRRIQSIDILRGTVMILMLLDHVRSYWNEGYGIDPLDLSGTTPLLFGTRWITHFCAPLFVFLTGASAYLTKARRNLDSSRSFRDMATRGVWLMALEIFLVSAFWGSVFAYNGILLQVIWAIGLSLLCLSLLQFLPSRVVGIIGLVLISAHNLLPELKGLEPIAQFLWDLLHQRGTLVVRPGYQIVVLYPVLPWIGVIALGYGAGELFSLPSQPRRKILGVSGLVAIALFVALRYFVDYGDPHPFHARGSILFSFLDFINLEKYPPSLLFLLATLGPGLLALAALDSMRLGEGHPLIVFGRTPMFYYLVHLPLIIITVIVWWLLSGAALPFSYPLWLTYVIWISLLFPLYMACRWYGRLKFAKPRWWTSLL